MKTSMTPRQCLDLAACATCRSCVDVCPAVQASGNAQLGALHRMKGMRGMLLQGLPAFLRRLLGGRGMDAQARDGYSDTVFKCTLCGRCEEVCPVGVGLKSMWLSLREELVTAGTYPAKIDAIRDNLEESRNVFGEENDERADWAEDLDDPPDDNYVRDTAELVYFTGCTAAYFPVAQKIPLALAEILERSGVDFAVMGEDEWCCGFPLLGAGLPGLAGEFAEHNIQAVKDRGARDVMFACPSCYAMWLERYPWKEHGLNIFHGTQYLRMLVEQGRVPMKRLEMTVTYHDPCDLGRGAREFDAPRELIRAIPGLTLVELPDNRENCACCGGGGNLEMIDAALSTDIAKAKIEQALSTGAEAVVTSCQQCVRTMLTYVRRNKINLKVLDITQLVAMALPDPDGDEADDE